MRLASDRPSDIQLRMRSKAHPILNLALSTGFA